MKKIVICLLLFSGTAVQAIFEYDRAIGAAQKDNFDAAAKLMGSVDTDRPDVLYDKGVIAYRQKNLQEARQNFLASADHPDATQDLIERAHFNTGNVSVALKDFADARDSYKKVLNINPHNSFAEHNLKKVEEILKEQEEQKKEDEKKEEKNKKNDQQKQDQKQNDSSEDKKQQKQKQEQENKKQENNQSKKDTAEQDNQSHKDEQQQKEKQGGEKDSSQERAEQHNADQKQSDGTQEQQGPDAQHAQQKQGRGSNERKNKNGTPQQMKGGNGAEDPATHDEWLAALLDKSNKRDAQENKKMIKAFVKQQMGGNEGQNCW